MTTEAGTAPVQRRVCPSPLGPLVLCERAGALCAVTPAGTGPLPPSEATPLLCAAEQQLTAYFAGSRRTFDLPLYAEGSPFRQAVWRTLTTIPYGTTTSYGDIACRIGRPGAARAVGTACRDNPLLVVVPCHRVVGRDGQLTGYAAGLPLKQWLLHHEACHPRR